jgi:S1-C subfamily serine protease
MARRITVRTWGLVASVAMGLLTLGLAPQPAQAKMDRATRLKVMKQVVKLRIMVRGPDGRWRQRGHGSGSIITADGLILTNNHVVSNTKTGQLYGAIAVAPNTGFDKAPKSVCIAWPRRAIRHPKLDLAIIKCEADMKGRPLRRKFNWPTVGVGDSRTLVPGDDIFIVGFPGVGGATVTFTSGKVSGFLADKRVGKGRVWIKTDALISGGVSGGAAFDESGKLIGVPTAYRRGSRGHTAIGLVRVIHKAKPLVAMARRRPWKKLPRVARVMPKPRRYPRGLRGYPQSPPPDARPVPRKLPPMPGYPRGGPPPSYPRGQQGHPPRGQQARPPRGPGREIRERARPRRRGAVRGFSSISGRVVDAYTQRPIRGAVIVVLKPGVNVYRVTTRSLRRRVATAGLSNARGFFVSKRPVRQGSKHGLIVIATGYKPLRLNKAVHLFRGGPPMLNLGLVKLRRKGVPRRPKSREPLPEVQDEVGRGR